LLLPPPYQTAGAEEGCYSRSRSPSAQSHETGLAWLLGRQGCLDVGPQVGRSLRLVLRQLVVQLLCPLGQSLLTVVLFHVRCVVLYSLIIFASIRFALKNIDDDVFSFMPRRLAISLCDRCSKTKRLSTVR
jgi:flagellar biosynthesis protein FliQ